MATLAQHLKTYKAHSGMTIREMAQADHVPGLSFDQSQLSTWMGGAAISPANVRKLVVARYLTREQAADALLGPDVAA